MQSSNNSSGELSQNSAPPSRPGFLRRNWRLLGGLVGFLGGGYLIGKIAWNMGVVAGGHATGGSLIIPAAKSFLGALGPLTPILGSLAVALPYVGVAILAIAAVAIVAPTVYKYLSKGITLGKQVYNYIMGKKALEKQQDLEQNSQVKQDQTRNLQQRTESQSPLIPRRAAINAQLDPKTKDMATQTDSTQQAIKGSTQQAIKGSTQQAIESNSQRALGYKQDTKRQESLEYKPQDTKRQEALEYKPEAGSKEREADQGSHTSRLGNKPNNKLQR